MSAPSRPSPLSRSEHASSPASDLDFFDWSWNKVFPLGAPPVSFPYVQRSTYRVLLPFPSQASLTSQNLSSIIKPFSLFEVRSPPLALRLALTPYISPFRHSFSFQNFPPPPLLLTGYSVGREIGRLLSPFATPYLFLFISERRGHLRNSCGFVYFSQFSFF